jgi:hypothetical protein
MYDAHLYFRQVLVMMALVVGLKQGWRTQNKRQQECINFHGITRNQILCRHMSGVKNLRADLPWKMRLFMPALERSRTGEFEPWKSGH